MNPYALVDRGGHTLDYMTSEALDVVEHLLNYRAGSLTIVQGSYHTGVVASGGTHDGGGAVDLTAQDWERKVLALRQVGFAAWHRTPEQGPWQEHVHAVLIGNEKLSAAAQLQVRAYLHGRNGLANNGPDDGPRQFVDRRFELMPAPTRAQLALSDVQIAAVAQKAGFKGDGLIWAVAVAIAESGGRPDAVNTNSDQWSSRDRGLWQINDHWHPEVSDAAAFNPAKCAKAAFKISARGTNWRPWSTFDNRLAYAMYSRAGRAVALLPKRTLRHPIKGKVLAPDEAVREVARNLLLNAQNNISRAMRELDL